MIVCTPNAQAKLRAEGHAFSPRIPGLSTPVAKQKVFRPASQGFLRPWQNKKREPKEPSASADC